MRLVEAVVSLLRIQTMTKCLKTSNWNDDDDDDSILILYLKDHH